MNYAPSPRIGVTLDFIDPNNEQHDASYSRFPWYALRCQYTECLSLAGGLSFGLAYDLLRVGEYAECLDGLVITGGGFDVDPALYGEKIRYQTVKINPKRTEFEMAMAGAMLDLNKPVLGICGGMQLLNVLMGGSLYQDIPAEIKSPINHSQVHERHLPQHDVEILRGTLLHSIYNQTLSNTSLDTSPPSIAVNSVHHQAVRRLGKDLQVNAKSADGIIEGIESTSHKFCLGVQWHPEFHVNQTDREIFKNFIKYCRD